MKHVVRGLLSFVLVAGMVLPTSSAETSQDNAWLYWFGGQQSVRSRHLTEAETTTYYTNELGIAGVTGQEAFVYEVQDLSTGGEDWFRWWFWGTIEWWYYTSAPLRIDIANPYGILPEGMFVKVGGVVNPSDWWEGPIVYSGKPYLSWRATQSVRWTKGMTVGFTVPARQYRATPSADNWANWYHYWTGEGSTPYGGWMRKTMYWTDWVNGSLLIPEPAPSDTTPPTVRILNLTPNPTRVNPLLTVSAEDVGGTVKMIEYSVDGEVYIPMTPSDETFDESVEEATVEIDISSLADGIVTVYVRAIDSADNLSATVTAEFVVDKTPPEITVHSPRAVSIVASKDILFDFEAVDRTSGVATVVATMTVAGTTREITDGETISAYDMGEGEHTLRVTATDNVGNVGVRTVTFKVLYTTVSLLRVIEQYLADYVRLYPQRDSNRGSCLPCWKDYGADRRRPGYREDRNRPGRRVCASGGDQSKLSNPFQGSHGGDNSS